MRKKHLQNGTLKSPAVCRASHSAYQSDCGLFFDLCVPLNVKTPFHLVHQHCPLSGLIMCVFSHLSAFRAQAERKVRGHNCETLRWKAQGDRREAGDIILTCQPVSQPSHLAVDMGLREQVCHHLSPSTLFTARQCRGGRASSPSSYPCMFIFSSFPLSWLPTSLLSYDSSHTALP